MLLQKRNFNEDPSLLERRTTKEHLQGIFISRSGTVAGNCAESCLQERVSVSMSPKAAHSVPLEGSSKEKC